MTSLASIPGTAVDPMWSTRNAWCPHAVFSRSTIRRAWSGHVGSAGTSRGGRDADGLAGADVVRERQYAADTTRRARVRPVRPAVPELSSQHIGNRAALFLGGLRGDPGAGVGLVHPALSTSRSTRTLHIGVHDDHQREHRRHTGLHQQRNVLDHNGILGDRRDDLRAALAHQGVHDPVESWRAARRRRTPWRPEPDDPAPRRQQDVLTERIDQRGQPLGTRLDDLTGDDIAVDDDRRRIVRTWRTAPTCRRRFRRSARCAASGQRDQSYALPASFSRSAASWASLASDPPAAPSPAARRWPDAGRRDMPAASAAANFSICAVCILCRRSASA